ncbi:MAG: hypothetical protein FJ318_05135 [SAR202 cluster bacterium]|nr:hypothetical protein [SAR202 cluster bacterium]
MRLCLRPLAVPAIAVILAVLLAACGSAATATPTPVPTPMPPIRIDAGTTGRDVVAQLPPDEADCLRRQMEPEAYEAMLNAPAASGLEFNSSGAAGCIGGNTSIALVTGVIAYQAGGDLSVETRNCIRGTLGALNLQQLLGAMTGPGPGSAGSVLGLLFCLSDDEAARISLAGLRTGDPDAGGPTLADIRCVSQRVDINTLAFALSQIDNPSRIPATVQLAFQECGVRVDDLRG